MQCHANRSMVYICECMYLQPAESGRGPVVQLQSSIAPLRLAICGGHSHQPSAYGLSNSLGSNTTIWKQLFATPWGHQCAHGGECTGAALSFAGTA